MARFLLDSDACIDYLKGRSGSIDLINDLSRRENRLCTCDVIVAEVVSGLSPAEIATGRTLLESFEYLPATFAAGWLAGRWRYDFARQGVTLPAGDCLIAAIAVEHGAGLITGNTRHYPMPSVIITPLPRAGP